MVVQSQFIEMFGNSLQNKELSIKLQDLIEKNWITYHLDGNHGGDYPRGEEFVESGIPYISANCIEDHLIKWSRAKYLTKERADLLKKGLAHNNDVLFAHNATVGPVAILRTKEDLVILGTSLTAYRCNTEYILPEYLLAYMDSPVFRVQYEAGMQQSTRNQVPITTQRSYKFFIPPLPAQRKYADVFQHADKSKFDGLKSQFIEMTKATSSIKLEDVAKGVFAGGDKPKDYSAVQGELYKYPVFSNGIGDNALLCFSKECRVKEAAITVSARGTIGYAECREAGFTPVVRLLALIPKDGYQLSYLKFALNNVTFHSTGSSQGQLTAPDFCKYEIPNAPKDVQLAFESIVHQADKSKYLS